MFKNNLDYGPKAVKSLFITKSVIYNYDTRNRVKMRTAYCKHDFMYSNFRFVALRNWNHILDHLVINITLPKLKKLLKHIFLLITFSYHIV